MKLSIITINFNNKEGLQRTIDSVITQTFTDYEWIVIDGGSTDGSKDLIEQYAEHFSYWISEPDKGIYNAMNKGILKATGDWLQFLNSGDWLFENSTLEKVFLKPYNADILYGDVMLISSNYRVLQKFPSTISLYYFLHHMINHQASFYKRILFENGLYNESYKIVSDWENYFKLILDNKKFMHINFPIVNFTKDGIGSIMNDEHINERNSVLKHCIPYHLRPDMEELDEYKTIKKFITNRKSFTCLMRCTYHFCQRVNPILLRIDKFRHRND